MSRRILLAPSTVKGNGSGHIVRCIALARELGPGAALYFPGSKTGAAWSAAELSLAYARELEGLELVEELSEAGSWDLVVLDRRAVSADELVFWESLGPVVALDEGGPSREAAPYLVDILPRAPGGGRRGAARRGRGAWDAPNASSLGFLPLPRNRRSPPREFRRVLVTFGGEDPAGLSATLSRALLSEGLVEPGNLTVVGGPLLRGGPPAGLEGAAVLGPVQDLKERLHGWDLVLTQFGLTAFEAAWAGCGVILLNPSPYHRRLSRAAGFPEIGVGSPDLVALRRLMSRPAETAARSLAVAPGERASLSAHLESLRPSGPRCCPLCGSPERAALYRDASRSYFRCLSCGTLYLARFSAAREDPYRRPYFFEEYRRQYGRTYLEDWPALTRLAESRLEVIEGIASRRLGRAEGLAVLDVGCAFGPFLAAARSRGQEPYGLDAAEEAATYVRTELGIPAAAGDFLDPAVSMSFGGPFDVLSLWYVIEHFADLDRALRNAAALLRPGGVLALSTPSGEGVSARSDRARFLEASPEDHFTVWEPSRVGALLGAYGFRLERVRITGHHPERFPFVRRLEAGPLGRVAILRLAARGLALAASRLLGLGDTFEAYATRDGEAGGPGAVGGGAGRRRGGRGGATPSDGGRAGRGSTRTG